MWSPRIHHDARVKYIGIVEAIEADIKSRKIKPGDRLPAQRFIADALNVDLTTVTRAINEAARRGLVETQPGSGCYVAQTSFTHYNSVHLSEGKPIDLSMNNPPNPAGIRLEQEIAQSLVELSYASSKPINHLSYQETVGHPEDREAGQFWLKNKVGNITSDLVLISSGAHSALFSVLSYLKREGAKAIAAPDLSYPGLRSIADYLQLDVFGVLMDNNGIIPEHLHDICQHQKIEALYVIPNIDNPTTSTLTAERRLAIVQLAEEFNFAIIEDDPYAVFVEQHIPSFYSLASQRVWHIATVSKCISPAFRVA
ncbi:MAG: PLP-dependent aminotransferase family protein [Methylophaga sp.]|uniref:aminotransferase-like domain-containing protein n=1 Tax=Methylophaga sp. TaxID=2024840 RepID=UPI00299EC7CD|nr:PLP-dependent aminotransferase family protein [Methylophaga sp.]MDX1748827.1 PLP-dependent aminotransferase family protein [Methylophaga sp.]|tara:strand:- start:5574 stop:6509 length:936 start_codon:yes stop_codon:yes gene_type:complete